MKLLASVALVAALMCATAQAAAISAPFDAHYTLVTLGSVAGVAPSYGGIAFLNVNTLLLGGAANDAAGVIDAVAVTRASNGHINGFGSVVQFASAPYIDGGLAFAQNGDLLFTGYPVNTIGEIKPGSSGPDKTVDLSGLGVASSVGSLAIVPFGYNGAGNLVIASYNAGTFCATSLTPDGLGTFDIGTCTANAASTMTGGPEGLIYVPQGSADFAAQSALVTLYGAGAVYAYSIDANGLPIASTGVPFITGLVGAEGAAIDPLTGDFLFTTFGGGNQILAAQGFVPPSGIPEPAAWFLMAGGLASIAGLRRRSSRT
jgi:hypothetical protein